MRFFYIILLCCVCVDAGKLKSVMKKSGSSSDKLSLTDDALLDNAILENEQILKKLQTKPRSSTKVKIQENVEPPMYVPISRLKYNEYTDALNPKIYLKTLSDALVFSTGMFEGLHIEAQEWMDNDELINMNGLGAVAYFKETDQPITPSTIANHICFKFIHLSVGYRARWYLYMVALQNLIRFKAPHPQFFEFVTNIFRDINYQESEFDAYAEVLENAFKGSLDLGAILKVKLARKFQEVRRNQTSTLQEKYEDMDLIAYATKENTFAMEELIVSTKFFDLLLPLLTKTHYYKDLLASKQCLRKFTFNANETSTQSLHRMRAVYEKEAKSDYLIEQIQNWYFGRKDVLPIEKGTLQDIIHFHVTNLMKKFASSFQTQMSKNAGPLFTFESIEFNPRRSKYPALISNGRMKDIDIVTETHPLGNKGSITQTKPPLFYKAWPKKAAPRELLEFNWHSLLSYAKNLYIRSPPNLVIHIKPSQAEALHLYQLLMTPDPENPKLTLTWDATHFMITKLGGMISTTGGSCHVIQFTNVNTSFPVRFDFSQYEHELGYKAYILKSIFLGWGMKMDTFVIQEEPTVRHKKSRN